MPEGIHDNTTDADREAIQATRERRAQVAKDAAAKREGKSTKKDEGKSDKTTTQG